MLGFHGRTFCICFTYSVKFAPASVSGQRDVTVMQRRVGDVALSDMNARYAWRMFHGPVIGEN